MAFRFAQNGGPGATLMFVDAYDVLFEAGEDAILQRFEKLRNTLTTGSTGSSSATCDIIFSAEDNCGNACIKEKLGRYTSSGTNENA